MSKLLLLAIAASETASKRGITVNGLLMLELCETARRMRAVSKEMCVTEAAATQLADTLVKCGLAKRLPVPGDRRGVLIERTKKGGELMEKVSAILEGVKA